MKVLRILALSCVLMPAIPQQAWPGEEASVIPRLVSPAAEPAVRWAVAGARRRLEQAACQSLFSEFSDASGRTLQSNLDALGQTGAEHLGMILFTDGSDRHRCKVAGPLAFTTPGSGVVYVCGRVFRDLARRDPRFVEAILIHEMLHTLGLGENPPSSAEITERVLAACR
jgi:hypothetical protein